MNEAYRTLHRSCAGTALALALLGVAACSPATENVASDTPVSSPVSSLESTGHILSAPQVKAITDAVNADIYDGSLKTASGPQPSYQLNAEKQKTIMNIREEDQSKWEKGTYRFQVFCIGQGTLNASFTVGDQTASIADMVCSEGVTSENVTLSIDEANNAVVSIEPSDDAKSEIAYRIDKL